MIRTIEITIRIPENQPIEEIIDEIKCNLEFESISSELQVLEIKEVTK